MSKKAKTDSRFETYIDESGDEGFVFRDYGSGSSRWFVLSAAVIRKRNDLQMVQCLRETRALLGRPPKKPLHFADRRHEQRLPFVRKTGAKGTVSRMRFSPRLRLAGNALNGEEG